MEEQLRNDEIEIDLLEIFHALVKKAWAIILCLVIGAGLAGGITKFAITPQYKATSMIYILGKTTSVSSAIDLQLSRQLTVDFEVLAKSRPVVERVISNLDLDMTYEEMLEIVEVTNPDNSSILQMFATHPDPEVAKNIANELADATAERVEEVMVTDRPSTVEQAVAPEHPSSPNVMKNTAIGGLAGAFLMMAIVIVMFLMDDTIKDEDDVKKYLDMSVLASIPADTTNAPVKKSKKVSRPKPVSKGGPKSGPKGKKIS